MLPIRQLIPPDISDSFFVHHVAFFPGCDTDCQELPVRPNLRIRTRCSCEPLQLTEAQYTGTIQNLIPSKCPA